MKMFNPDIPKTISELKDRIIPYLNGLECGKNHGLASSNPHKQDSETLFREEWVKGFEIGKLLRKWKVGDKFIAEGKPERVFRVHRASSDKIWYIGDHYGYNLHRGVLRSRRKIETGHWLKKTDSKDY